MSKEQSNNETSATQKQAMSKEDRSSLVLGIVAVLIVVGIFCLLLAAMTNGKRIQGEFALADDEGCVGSGCEGADDLISGVPGRNTGSSECAARCSGAAGVSAE